MMKKMLFVAAALLMTVAVFAQKATDVAKFTKLEHDFGKVKLGTSPSYEFEFKNISKKPLVVESTVASCGCTVPDRPEKPIMPGETGKITVRYNATDIGTINRDVQVKFAGVDEPEILYIKGAVVN